VRNPIRSPRLHPTTIVMGNKIINSKTMLQHAMPLLRLVASEGFAAGRTVAANHLTSPREEAGRGEDGADIQRCTALCTRGG
jgi:hypothetical protein